MSAVNERVDKLIAENKVMVFSKSYCPFCTKAKNALKSKDIDAKILEIENDKDVEAIQDYLNKLTGKRSVPRVFINGKCIGGGDETEAAAKSGSLEKLVTG